LPKRLQAFARMADSHREDQQKSEETNKEREGSAEAVGRETWLSKNGRNGQSKGRRKKGTSVDRKEPYGTKSRGRNLLRRSRKKGCAGSFGGGGISRRKCVFRFWGLVVKGRLVISRRKLFGRWPWRMVGKRKEIIYGGLDCQQGGKAHSTEVHRTFGKWQVGLDKNTKESGKGHYLEAPSASANSKRVSAFGKSGNRRTSE